MEGHTDAKPFNGRENYSNWDLSTDRANSARRWMQDHGMRDDQVTQVRGFADQSLRKPDDPGDPSNRRVTLIIQYQKATPSDMKPEAAPAKADTKAPPGTAAATPSKPSAAPPPGTKPAAKP
jgi:chemotaxis protein MotB